MENNYFLITARYFPHWNNYGASHGYHWDMYDAQGERNVWFIGGGVSFESLKSVMEYNRLLISKMYRPHHYCYKHDDRVWKDD